MTTTQAKAADRDLLLAVELNARPLDMVVEFRENGGELFVQRDDFDALGLVMPRELRKKLTAEIALSQLPGVTFRVDEPRQLLLITADDQALVPQVLGEEIAVGPPDRTSLGAVLNYDIYGNFGGQHAVAGLFDMQINVLQGTLESGLLVQSPDASPAVRLSTSFLLPDFGGQRDWTLGDVVSGGLSWTRPFRLGGGQVQSSFAMRPDIVTMPLPVLGGRTAVPSTVDVMVDGVREFSEGVQSGPFVIRQPPMLNGAGDYTVVIRDPLGQQTAQTVPFYISPALLAPGLSSYSVETGLVRNGYATPNDQYGQAVGSASLRYGLSSLFTGEAHLEAGPTVQMFGIGGVVNVANLGIASFAVAGSRSIAGSGLLYSAGVEHADKFFSAAISLTRRTMSYVDVPAASGDPVPTQTARASVGFNLGTFGNLQAAYVTTAGGLVPVYENGVLTRLKVGDARVGTLSYSRSITDRVSFYVTAFRDFAELRSAGVVFGINAALGTRSSVGTTLSDNDGMFSAGVNAVQNASEVGQLGGRLQLNSDAALGETAEATYLSQYAQGTAGMDRYGRQNSFRGELQGALVAAGGGVYATKAIGDSYAVVDTDGHANVPVLLENRLVGHTDSSGRLLVPDLRGWDINRLSIDPTSLPADVIVEGVQKSVRPISHGSVFVSFRMLGGESAVIRLANSDGSPTQVGSRAILQRTGRTFTVGYDGEVFVSGMKGEERLKIDDLLGQCTADFTFKPVPGEIPSIGPIPCVAAPAP